MCILTDTTMKVFTMEDVQDPCFICNRRYQDAYKNSGGSWCYNCDRCGAYECASVEVCSAIAAISSHDRPKISGWVRSKNRLGYHPTISLEKLQDIVSCSIPSSTQRALYYLKEALATVGGIGTPFHYLEERYVGATFSTNSDDLHPLLEHLQQNGYINHVTIGGPKAFAMITVHGEEASLTLTD